MKPARGQEADMWHGVCSQSSNCLPYKSSELLHAIQYFGKVTQTLLLAFSKQQAIKTQTHRLVRLPTCTVVSQWGALCSSHCLTAHQCGVVQTPLQPTGSFAAALCLAAITATLHSDLLAPKLCKHKPWWAVSNQGNFC